MTQNYLEPFSLVLEDAILKEKYHVEHVDLEVAKFAFHKGKEVAAGKSYPSLVNICMVKKMDPEAREFLASHEAYNAVSAGAIIVKSVYQQIGGNVYLFLKKQPIPTRVFVNEHEAIEWLNQFKNIQAKVNINSLDSRI